MSMRIAIVTPAGNIGSEVVRRLLPTDTELIVLQRNPEKLPSEVRAKARVEQGSLEDPAFVARATRGADALFWLTPYSLSEPDQDARYATLMASAAGAITENHIPYVVNLSTFGAQCREGAGFASYVGKMEEHLNATGAHILHLRPGFFMENFLLVLPWIQAEGVVPLPLPGSATLPMVATRDIGAVAAERLLHPDWEGQRIHGVHGPTDLSLEQATAILGTAVGKSLAYTEAPWPMFEQALRGMGASEAGVRCDVELMTAFAQPGIVAEPRTPETTTPTTLEAWGRTVLRPLLEK